MQEDLSNFAFTALLSNLGVISIMLHTLFFLLIKKEKLF